MATIWTLTKTVTTEEKNFAHTTARVFSTAEAMHKAVRSEVDDMVILEAARIIMNEYDMDYARSENKGVFVLLKTQDERIEFNGMCKEIED